MMTYKADLSAQVCRKDLLAFICNVPDRVLKKVSSISIVTLELLAAGREGFKGPSRHSVAYCKSRAATD